MVKPSIPPEELQQFEMRRRLGELTAKVSKEAQQIADRHQFEDDFTALAFAILAPIERTSVKVRNNGGATRLRRASGPRRLPFSPLRRLAKRMGPKVLRYLIEVGSEQSNEFFRLELRRRLDKEYPQGNIYKSLGEDLEVIRFGHEVLTIERDLKISRGAALEHAAGSLRMATGSIRNLEREFRRFKELCKALGYVPHPLASSGSRPCFSLRDLDRRATDKSQK